MSSSEEMSLSFAIHNLVLLSFPPEVMSHRLYLSYKMGCPGKSSREISFVNSSMAAQEHVGVFHSLNAAALMNISQMF